MEHEHAEENVCVAAHQADPAGLAFEDHEDGEVDDGSGERGAGADEGAVGHAGEGRVGVGLVGVQTTEGDDEEEG